MGYFKTYYWQVIRIILLMVVILDSHLLSAQGDNDTIYSIIKEEIFKHENKKMVSSRKLAKEYILNTGQILGAIIKQYNHASESVELTAYTEKRRIGHKYDLNYIDYLIVVKLEFDTLASAAKCYNMLFRNMKYISSPDTHDLYITLKSGFLFMQYYNEIWFILVNDCGTNVNKDAYMRLRERASNVVRVRCGLNID